MKQDEFSFLGNIDIDIVEALYIDYRKDPGSVEESWQQFFKGFDFAREEFKDQMPVSWYALGHTLNVNILAKNDRLFRKKMFSLVYEV